MRGPEQSKDWFRYHNPDVELEEAELDCIEPRALFVSPLIFGAARDPEKALTPGRLRFLLVFHCFVPQSHENQSLSPCLG